MSSRMTKRPVSFFVSYAKKNKSAVDDFIEKFQDQVGASKRFSYSLWSDKKIPIGEDWHDSIQKAVHETDFGLLLLSPAFLNSNYIAEHELPEYLRSDGKHCFPVMLAKVDLVRHDLKGVEKKQIFRLDSNDFAQPRAYTELKPKRKLQFAEELFANVDDWLYDNLR